MAPGYCSRRVREPLQLDSAHASAIPAPTMSKTLLPLIEEAFRVESMTNTTWTLSGIASAWTYVSNKKRNLPGILLIRDNG